MVDLERLEAIILVLLWQCLSDVDPLHSCLGLASLALNGESDLLPLDATLCITQRAKDRLKNAPWR